MQQHPWPNFARALQQLAPTNDERAALLGVSPRSVIEYLQGRALPRADRLKRLQVLDDALTLDIRPPSSGAAH